MSTQKTALAESHFPSFVRVSYTRMSSQRLLAALFLSYQRNTRYLLAKGFIYDSGANGI